MKMYALLPASDTPFIVNFIHHGACFGLPVPSFIYCVCGTSICTFVYAKIFIYPLLERTRLKLFNNLSYVSSTLSCSVVVSSST